MDAQVIERNEPFPSIVKLVVGLFIAVVGVLLTADNLDLVNAGDFLQYWPAVLVLIGILKMFDASSRMVAVLLMIAGSWLLAYNLEWINFTLFDMWPLVLIGIGLILVGRAVGVGPQGIALPKNAAFFGQKKVAETSKDYRGGHIAAILGGYELDLTAADITQGPAVLETLSIWGAIEIYVPENWEIIGEVTPIMAGFEVKSTGKWDPRKQLVVKGLALMGGIEVKRK